jgi:hypothetical protein
MNRGCHSFRSSSKPRPNALRTRGAPLDPRDGGDRGWTLTSPGIGKAKIAIAPRVVESSRGPQIHTVAMGEGVPYSQLNGRSAGRTNLPESDRGRAMAKVVQIGARFAGVSHPRAIPYRWHSACWVTEVSDRSGLQAFDRHSSCMCRKAAGVSGYGSRNFRSGRERG